MAVNPKSLANLIPCKKWQSSNPKWRPKSLIWLANEELKKAWFHPVTRWEIEAHYMQLLSLWEDNLKLVAQDKGQPMLMRIVAKSLLSGKWFEIAERMLDRWIWKALQKQEMDVNGTFSLVQLHNNTKEKWKVN